MSGDEAAVLVVAGAAAHPRDHPSAGDERAAAVGEALPLIGNGRLPRHLAGVDVERDEVGVGGVDEDLVAVDAQIAQRPAAAADPLREPAAVLPDQIAGGGVERVDDVAGTGEEHHAVVHERRRLLRARLQRPGPDEPQPRYVVTVDLVEGAVAPALR